MESLEVKFFRIIKYVFFSIIIAVVFVAFYNIVPYLLFLTIKGDREGNQVANIFFTSVFCMAIFHYIIKHLIICIINKIKNKIKINTSNTQIDITVLLAYILIYCSTYLNNLFGETIKNGFNLQVITVYFMLYSLTQMNINKREILINGEKILMLICFVFLLQTDVFAQTYDISQISQVKLVTEYSTDTTIDQMDIVTFGTYPQSDASGNTKDPIEWLVLDRDGDKAFLLSKYILDVKVFDDSYVNETWETCSLRKWMNTTFFNMAFDNTEKQHILLTNVVNETYEAKKSDGTTKKYGDAGNNTSDKVFCLSQQELVTYKKNFRHNFRDGYTPVGFIETYFTNYCIINNYNTMINQRYKIQHAYTIEELLKQTYRHWWLRTPYGSSNGTRTITIENPDGDPITFKYGFRGGIPMSNIQDTMSWEYADWLCGVRPALWIDLKAISDVANNNKITVDVESANQIQGLPSRESELRSDNHFYLDNNMQKSTWVYYVTYYYHVDGQGNIEKSKWIEQRYVGEDGRMYRGRKTPDGKWVGDDGLVVDVISDLSNSITVKANEPDSWYKTQSGLWYYFENDRTTTKKGWFTDSRDNQTYYLDPQTGIMAVGWTTINGSQYYFNESHDNEPNWYEVGGGFYESYGKKVKAYGSMFKNETTSDGKRVDGSGRLITNYDSDTIVDESFSGLKDGFYYVNGIKQIDTWVTINGYHYKFDENGHNYILNP